MINNNKNIIRFLTYIIVFLFTFMSLNVNFVYATRVSGYDAEQELKRQREVNETRKNINKDILVVEEDDEEEFDDTGAKKKPIGHQLYDTEHHDNLYDKSNVITAGGGGNMGEGGGATKSAGGKTGKSINISDAGTSNQEVIKNSVSDTDGKDLISETMGFAKDDGEFYKEDKGDHAGVKIFELDRNGSFGFDDDHIAVSNMKGFMSFFLFAAFGLGGLTFFMASRDTRRKNSYF